ncbi:MAG: hypothetical protein KGJ23_09825 [Euryarchaeota archaeon]|nr:hypothetical protein [Euryarchaeota archaeon]MDE1836901.1 hypothetical protein [Euryarchaeota archaeon]MDE1881714.1 hypothetical protein [Euryarchaeota archaeon]MDE2045304.1 hypothetical protein [Thermoplasmata archaeon]
MPLELTIIVLVLAMVLPIVIGGFLAFRSFQETDQMEVVVNDIVSTAVQTFEGDLNTTLLLDVNPGGALVTVGAALLTSGGTPNYQAAWAVGVVGSTTYRALASTGAGNVLMTNLSSALGPAFPTTVGSSMTLFFEKRAYPLPGGGVLDYVLVGRAYGG